MFSIVPDECIIFQARTYSLHPCSLRLRMSALSLKDLLEGWNPFG